VQQRHKEWLNPALGWIRQHHPEELQEIYRDDNPVFNRDSAKRWTELLREWREATGQPAIR